MDCPRCGGDLEAYTLRDSRAVICRGCGWVGTEATLADVDGPESTRSWEDALAEVSVRGGSVDRRRDDLPAVPTAGPDDSAGESAPEVTRLPDAPPFEARDGEVASDGDAGMEPDDDAETGAAGAAEGLETIAGEPDELEQLRAAGIETVEELAAADHLDLAGRTSLSEDRIRTYVRRASIQVVTDDPESE